MMKRIDPRAWFCSMSDIYNRRDEYAHGRLISLISALVTAFYNVFITGIFHTGFLTMYGMSISDYGIITFIPYIANCFSIFSSMVLGRFKRRKKVVLAAKIYFYAMYILATTIMPQFVLGQRERMYCFIAIQFLAHSVYALFNPGLTAWFYNFYPQDNERRTRYIMLNQIFASVMSSFVLLFSGVLTDAVSGSPYQRTLILGMRYLAFVLVLVDVSMQARAKEYPYPETARTRFSDVFTLSFRYRKFLMCLLLMFAWNYIANLNNGLWGYHLLNHMRFGYTLINAMSIMYTFILVFTAPAWRRVLRRYSWIKTFGLTNLLWVPTEVGYFFMSVDRPWMYVPLSVWQNLLAVGLNLSYANVLYMNLPEENSTAHIAFYTIGCNVFAFLGLLTGTAVSSITGDVPVRMLGMEVYSVQFTTLMRALAQLTIGLVLTLRWRSFTNDRDIAEVESQAAVSATHARRLRAQWRARLKRGR